MKTVTGDIWTYAGRAWIVVPTNLVVNSEHRAAMGLGIAAQAREKYPGLDRIYGTFLLMAHEHLPQLFTLFTSGKPLYGGLILFPTKDHWTATARLDYIEQGLQHLTKLPITGPIVLPFLGIGYGKLAPAPVYALLVQYLTEDRFTLVERGPEVTHKYRDSFRTNRRPRKHNALAFHDRSLTEERE